MRDHRPASDRLDHLLGALRRARQHLSRAVRVHAEAPGVLGREQLIRRGLGGSDRDRDLPVGEACEVLDRHGAHARGERLLGLGRGGGGIGRAERLLQPAQRLAQLEPAEGVPKLGAIGRRAGEGLEVELDVDVALSRGQLLGDPGRFGVLGQVLLALGAADVVDVGEDVFERAEPLQQVGRGLIADAWDPGDVVARVALQSDEVGDQLGRNAVAVDHALAVVDPGVGDAARGGHDFDHTVVDQLVGVAVAGHDHHGDLRVIGTSLFHDRGDHVVGLVPLDSQVAVSERLHERLEGGPLLLEQIGAGGPLRLVLRVQRLTPRVPRVPDHHGRLRAVVGQDLHQHRGEPEDRVRRHAGGGGDRLGEGEESPVGQAVAVDQEELFGGARGHTLRLSRLGAPPPLPIRLRKPGTVGTFLDQALPRWSTPCELATTNRPAPGFVHQPLVPGNLGRTGASERIGRLLGRAHPGAPSPDHPG